MIDSVLCFVSLASHSVDNFIVFLLKRHFYSEMTSCFMLVESYVWTCLIQSESFVPLRFISISVLS